MPRYKADQISSSSIGETGITIIQFSVAIDPPFSLCLIIKTTELRNETRLTILRSESFVGAEIHFEDV